MTETDNHLLLSEQLQLGVAGEHLVCFDLIMKGYVAFPAAQGLPYDVLVHTKTGVKRIQVKSTTKKRTLKKSRDIYRFLIRRGRNLEGASPNAFDYLAFVALDARKIAYMTSTEATGKDGLIKRTLEFRDRDVKYEGRLFSNGTTDLPMGNS